eukprot:Skav227199  [mRNA]  locus=scaffold2048:225951:230172:- [translate_table: standard]
MTISCFFSQVGAILGWLNQVMTCGRVAAPFPQLIVGYRSTSGVFAQLRQKWCPLNEKKCSSADCLDCCVSVSDVSELLIIVS